MGNHRREEVGRKRESKEGKKERKTGFFLSFLSIVSFFFSFFIRQGEVQKKEGPESMRSCKCLFVCFCWPSWSGGGPNPLTTRKIGVGGGS